MSFSDSDAILIRANAKRNGITTLVLGGVGLLLSFLWLSLLPKWLFLGGIFMTSAAIVTCLVGWFKVREPQYSFAITPHGITYRHRLGKWQIPFKHLISVDCPRVRHGLDHVELQAVGFKINDYTLFLKSISPRLATHLLMEQRPLLLQNTDSDCASGSCYDNQFIDDRAFTLSNGEVLTGIKAMLGHRMRALRDRLGFDVYIAPSELDRDASDFVRLIRECHAATRSAVVN